MGEPTPDPGGAEKVPRAPRLTDLGRLGAELNRLGARYVVVGGFAIIQAGYARFTTDLDLLVDTSPENEAKIFEALRSLPDQAVNQLDPGDIEKFTVVRVGDEILVDLMKSGCGVDYAEAIKDVQFHEIEGVRISLRVAKNPLAHETNQTRERRAGPPLFADAAGIPGRESGDRAAGKRAGKRARPLD